MDSSEAAFSICREEPDSVLTLRGKLHLDLARELHRMALDLAMTGGSVVVDLSAAEFLDGWVIQILLALKLALEHGAGSLRLRGESGEIREYLAWAGAEAHFPAPGLDSKAAIAQPRKKRKSARKPAV
ncbi:MAG TPA: STAS domain-containing protein [Bryobacteraceae bacterium]|nr:STAS domain-containing protein [Bryobacteraceae bacterium]